MNVFVVCLDFDGVINLYPGWENEGYAKILGEPVEGSKESIKDLRKDKEEQGDRHAADGPGYRHFKLYFWAVRLLCHMCYSAEYEKGNTFDREVVLQGNE